VLIEYGLSFVAIVAAIILHEVSHGYTALALGDDTARRLGRLSLNPIVHVDRVGTIIVPLMLLGFQLLARTGTGLIFGWAKPVPVDARHFPNPRRGMMVVAMAGPAMNFLLAWLTLLALHLTPLLGHDLRFYALVFAAFFLIANIALGTFNLLPILPLDGGRIVAGLLPERLAVAWAGLERGGLVIVLLLIFLAPAALGEFGIAFDPLRFWLHQVGDPIFGALSAAAGSPPDLRFVLRYLEGAAGG
jgi:Zn-dependent protease